LIIPADARLTRRYAGQPVGYRVLTLDRTTHAPFTNERVVEMTPAHYMVAGGCTVPDAGGYLVWGVPGRDIATVSVEPSPTANVPALLDALYTRLFVALGEMGEAQRKQLAQRLDAIDEAQQTTAQWQTDTNGRLLNTMSLGTEILEHIEKLDGLDDIADYMRTVEQAAHHINKSGFGAMLRLVERVDSQRKTGQRRMQTIAEIDELIEAMGHG